MAPQVGQVNLDRRYERMSDTLVASWAFLAEGSQGARVVETAGARAAVFPADPARQIFNNALLPSRPDDPTAAIEALEGLYRDAGVDSFAAWAHESDEATRAALLAHGYAHEETTHLMAMELSAATVELASDPRVDIADPSEAFEVNGLAADLLVDLPPSGRFYVLREDGRAVSAALAFRHEGDCGISFVATRPESRRRGHCGAAMRHALAAAAQGCTTSSLQATTISQSLYRSLGYRDLGRNLEYRLPSLAPRT